MISYTIPFPLLLFRLLLPSFLSDHGLEVSLSLCAVLAVLISLLHLHYRCCCYDAAARVHTCSSTVRKQLQGTSAAQQPLRGSFEGCRRRRRCPGRSPIGMHPAARLPPCRHPPRRPSKTSSAQTSMPPTRQPQNPRANRPRRTSIRVRRLPCARRSPQPARHSLLLPVRRRRHPRKRRRRKPQPAMFACAIGISRYHVHATVSLLLFVSLFPLFLRNTLSALLCAALTCLVLLSHPQHCFQPAFSIDSTLLSRCFHAPQQQRQVAEIHRQHSSSTGNTMPP